MRSSKRYIFTALFCFTATLLIYSLTIKKSKFIEVSDYLQSKDFNKGASFIEKEHNDQLLSLNDEQVGELSSFEEPFDGNGEAYKSSLDLSSSKNEASFHLLDHIRSPTEIRPFNFRGCSFETCFDFSRCDHKGPLKVFIVPKLSLTRVENENNNTTLGESNVIHKNIIRIIRNSKHFEPDPRKACMFVLEDDTLDRDPLSPSFQQDLSVDTIFNGDTNYGMNHLIFNLYSGTWPDYNEDDFAGLSINAAILAKASNSLMHHRRNFDISLPLFSYTHPYSDEELKEDWLNTFSLIFNKSESETRAFFLTFKGKRYIFGSGSETRNSLYHLNNQRDVIMLTTCRHGKKWRELSDHRCLADELSYNQYDFIELMRNSTFCLVPRGRRLGSFRFLEAMSYGCIPVILSDGWVLPFEDIINWSSATIQLKESLLLQVPDILRDLDKKTISKMRKNSLRLYKDYFSTTERIILTTLSVIEQRIKSRVSLKKNPL